MNIRKYLFAIPSLLLIGLIGLNSATLAHAETIKLANGEWAPYLSEKLKNAGHVSDIVKQAFAHEGITVEYDFLPWKRGFEDAKKGKFEGSIVWSKTEDREKHFLYSAPVLDLQTVFFMKTDGGFDWTDTASLTNKKLGGVIGYSYGLDNEEKAGTVKISRIGKAEANYKKLESGRLDAVLEDKEVGYAQINDLGFSGKLISHPKPLKSRTYHLIITKANKNAQRYIDSFNKGLQKLKDSGKFEEIIQAARRGEYK